MNNILLSCKVPTLEEDASIPEISSIDNLVPIELSANTANLDSSDENLANQNNKRRRKRNTALSDFDSTFDDNNSILNQTSQNQQLDVGFNHIVSSTNSNSQKVAFSKLKPAVSVKMFTSSVDKGKILYAASHSLSISNQKCPIVSASSYSKSFKYNVSGVDTNDSDIYNQDIIDDSMFIDDSNNSDNNSSILMPYKKLKQDALVNDSDSLNVQTIGNSNSQSVSVSTTYIPMILPNPRSQAWINIKNNIRTEDEPVLRYVPYFGDDDVTGVDVSAYDQVPGELEHEVCSEPQEVLILYMIRRHRIINQSDSILSTDLECIYESSLKFDSYKARLGTSFDYQVRPEVLTALERVLNITTSQLLKAYERAIEGLKDRLRVQSITGYYNNAKDTLKSTRKPKYDLNDKLSLLIQIEQKRIKQYGSKAMVDLLGYGPSIYSNRDFIDKSVDDSISLKNASDSNAKSNVEFKLELVPISTQKKPKSKSSSVKAGNLKNTDIANAVVEDSGDIVSRLGLKNTKDYIKMIESYRELFCRRCYIYDCQAHGVMQPLPNKRCDPNPPYPCPIPGVKISLIDKLRLNHTNSAESIPSELNIEDVRYTQTPLFGSKSNHDNKSNSRPTSVVSHLSTSSFIDNFKINGETNQENKKQINMICDQDSVTLSDQESKNDALENHHEISSVDILSLETTEDTTTIPLKLYSLTNDHSTVSDITMADVEKVIIQKAHRIWNGTDPKNR